MNKRPDDPNEMTTVELLEEMAEGCESGDWGQLDEWAAALRARRARLQIALTAAKGTAAYYPLAHINAPNKEPKH